MVECYFLPSKTTSSATICANCGKEKLLHTIGEGIKVSKSIIITKKESKQDHGVVHLYCYQGEKK